MGPVLYSIAVRIIELIIYSIIPAISGTCSTTLLFAVQSVANHHYPFLYSVLYYILYDIIYNCVLCIIL